MIRSLLTALSLAVATPALAEAGTLAHYVRTGLDGAEPEHIYVYRDGERRVEAYKMQSRCTSAGLVIAEMGPDRGEVRRITGGRLTREGTQQPVARMTLDPVTRTLDLRVDLPGQTITDTKTLGEAPLWLYDFDSGDLALAGDKASRSLAYTWPEGDTPLMSPGRADFTLAGEETRGGRKLRRYRAGGPAFAGDQGGEIWVDAANGRLVEARLGRPNHPGYKGLSLRLTEEKAADEAAWRSLLLSHYDGCPAR